MTALTIIFDTLSYTFMTELSIIFDTTKEQLIC